MLDIIIIIILSSAAVSAALFKHKTYTDTHQTRHTHQDLRKILYNSGMARVRAKMAQQRPLENHKN